jgi:acyl dehydratase
MLEYPANHIQNLFKKLMEGLMGSNLPMQRGMFFEEFELGQKLISPGRTITEADVVNFAGLSGDFYQLHTDAEYGKTTPFGQRIAHGVLVLSIATGLTARTGVLEGTALAFREIVNWKFSLPVFIGDTIHTQMEVIEVKPLPRIDGGSVKLKVAIVNQDEKVVMRGVWVVLVVSKNSVVD